MKRDNAEKARCEHQASHVLVKESHANRLGEFPQRCFIFEFVENLVAPEPHDDAGAERRGVHVKDHHGAENLGLERERGQSKKVEERGATLCLKHAFPELVTRRQVGSNAAPQACGDHEVLRRLRGHPRKPTHFGEGRASIWDATQLVERV